MKAINVEIKENGNQTIVFLKDKVFQIETRNGDNAKIAYWSAFLEEWKFHKVAINSKEYKGFQEDIDILKNIKCKTRPEVIRSIYRAMKGRHYERGLKEYQIN